MGRPRRLTTGNKFLDSLPPHEQGAILALCSLIELKPGDTTYKAGRRYRYVYFPVDCAISLLVRMANGSEAELIAMGREGGHGATRAVVGIDKASYHSICSLAGRSYRISTEAFRRLAVPGTTAYRRALQYHASLIIGIGFFAGCNRFHTPVQRTACWLLLGADHTGRDTLELTHAFLGRLLGIHRPAASLAAGQLQRSGAISYRRGKVAIRSRKRLASLACECYGKLSAEFRRLYR